MGRSGTTRVRLLALDGSFLGSRPLSLDLHAPKSPLPRLTSFSPTPHHRKAVPCPFCGPLQGGILGFKRSRFRFCRFKWLIWLYRAVLGVIQLVSEIKHKVKSESALRRTTTFPRGDLGRGLGKAGRLLHMSVRPRRSDLSMPPQACLQRAATSLQNSQQEN